MVLITGKGKGAQFLLQGHLAWGKLTPVYIVTEKDAIMATIVPHSHLVAKAVEYVLLKLSEKTQESLVSLIDDAAMRFNLSPVEAESLLRLLQEATSREIA